MLRPYPLREWDWFWIVMGALWSIIPAVVYRAVPSPVFLLLTAVGVFFGVWASPVARRVIKGDY